jgi:hypothetical protein
MTIAPPPKQTFVNENDLEAPVFPFLGNKTALLEKFGWMPRTKANHPSRAKPAA